MIGLDSILVLLLMEAISLAAKAAIVCLVIRVVLFPALADIVSNRER